MTPRPRGHLQPRRSDKPERDAALLARRAEGATLRELEREFRLSEARVAFLLRRAAEGAPA